MLPTIKKRLSSFILNEEGKISKSSLLKLSAFSVSFVLSSKIVSAGCGCSCGCACGGGGCGGGCGGGGGGCGAGGPCPRPGDVSPGGGCG